MLEYLDKDSECLEEIIDRNENNVDYRQYVIYLLRWQLSTPIMTPITMALGATIEGALSANIVGGLIFFWIDKFLFSSDHTNLTKKYIFYLGRWQLTSITLFPCLLLFGSGLQGVIVANLIGGLVFYWIDKYIFSNRIVPVYWEIVQKTTCFDCGKVGRGYRIVKAKNYNRSKDKAPQYRCEECSDRKVEELKERGVEV